MRNMSTDTFHENHLFHHLIQKPNFNGPVLHVIFIYIMKCLTNHFIHNVTKKPKTNLGSFTG